MISQTAEYALRAVVCLADHDGGPMTTQQVAEKTQVPAGYLSKVLQALARVGLVDSQRGPTGGYTLRGSLDAISVLDVVNTVDPLARITSCPLGLSSHGAELCALHRRLDQAVADVESSFRQSSIADLLREGSSPPPLRERSKA